MIVCKNVSYGALRYASAAYGLVYMIKDHDIANQLSGIKIKDIYRQRNNTGHTAG